MCGHFKNARKLTDDRPLFRPLQYTIRWLVNRCFNRAMNKFQVRQADVTGISQAEMHLVPP